MGRVEPKATGTRGRTSTRLSRPLAALAIAVSKAAGCEQFAVREVIIDVTNERDAPVVVRIVPDILPGHPTAGPNDRGTGAGWVVGPGESVTVPLTVASDRWSVTVNGAPVIRSSDPEIFGEPRVRARLVVRRESQLLEVVPGGPDPVE